MLIEIKGVKFEVNKNEAKEALRYVMLLRAEDTVEMKAYVQKACDIWMRSASTDQGQVRRKAVARALGLSDVITFE